MTYREAIHEMAERSYSLYTITGSMRDRAAQSEKAHWGKLRDVYREAYSVLNSLDNQLSDERAATQLRFSF